MAADVSLGLPEFRMEANSAGADHLWSKAEPQQSMDLRIVFKSGVSDEALVIPTDV